MSVLTYFPVSSIRLRDGSIPFYYHQVDPSNFRLVHGDYSFLFPIISILVSFQCHHPSIFRNSSDTILSGKAKVMIVGGFDDISKEGSYEFANMKATSNLNAETEFAMGREPTEMSRPAT
jgi:hypothetical protein